jgi:hypothetical protein
MGIYNFGMPDVLIRIHFPNKENQGRPQNESLPWFWYLSPPEAPYYFQYISPNAKPSGRGWQRTQNFPMIKILPIDTQVLQPTPILGFKTLEDAIDNGEPDAAYGRFQFTDNFFWKVMGFKRPPDFVVNQGKPTGPAKAKPPISTVIRNAVQRWRSHWNFGASDFNKKAGANLPSTTDGVSYDFPSTQFALPLPSAPDIATAAAQAQEQLVYLGPVPGGFWFMQGHIAIYKQAYSFHMNVGQLDFNHWRMDEWPPRRTGLTPLTAGFETDD